MLRAHIAREDNGGEDSGLMSLRRLTPHQAALLLVVLAACLISGLGAGFAHVGSNWRKGGDDGRLYTSLINHVAHGDSYYAVAPEELRRRGFPLRPFLTVRPPLLTLALARLPNPASRYAALAALAAAAWLAWARRLWPEYRDRPVRGALALAMLASGIGLALSQGAYLFHESWAGLLIALSLAVWGPRVWVASLALGLAAALIRELAIPYLAVMALFAWREGRRGEAAAWLAAIAVACAALARHAVAVAAVTRASDPASSGWMGLGGYPFVVHLAQLNCVLFDAPLWIAALVLPTALLGLVFFSAGGASRAQRTAFTVLGYAAGFCLIGRPDNDYWGLMIAPLWPLGLIEADRVLKAVFTRAARLRPLPVLRQEP